MIILEYSKGFYTVSTEDWAVSGADFERVWAEALHYMRVYKND